MSEQGHHDDAPGDEEVVEEAWELEAEQVESWELEVVVWREVGPWDLDDEVDRGRHGLFGFLRWIWPDVLRGATRSLPLWLAFWGVTVLVCAVVLAMVGATWPAAMVVIADLIVMIVCGPRRGRP